MNPSRWGRQGRDMTAGWRVEMSVCLIRGLEQAPEQMAPFSLSVFENANSSH